ncbi:uncharacterized protein LOC128263407 [Drosophila gunungcola]|uniref:Uncharacterized protein n=1 Tax=Drosophila gunungcola TaxID=103775 RepID=A0A9Q0BSW6_9MUSC|nr:uncharacterized protein LOC128263407 [Drosophila gunungcola]KAI8043517.1 hypothetical protein M5D96_004849 [Drosophila gunungcola]
MFKLLIITVLGILMYQMVSCDPERYLCRRQVVVSYTENVVKPMNDYGNFAKYFTNLGISAGNKTVTKTKMQEEEICCPGYEKFPDGLCGPVETTTDTATTISTSTSEEPDSTTSTESNEGDSSSPSSLINPAKHSKAERIKNSHKHLTLGIIFGVLALIIAIATVITWQIRKRRNVSIAEDLQVKFDAEMQRALL